MPLDIDQHRKLAIAPMMELTDRHYRYLARLLSKHALLYTEMLTCAAIIHGDRQYLLGKHSLEDPVVLQLGGSDPDQMASAARIGEQWGYQEINMNVGCPSDRVKAGRFGACLMAEPARVADTVSAMQDAVCIPVSVKCRLGIDRDDSYTALQSFVGQVAQSGCSHFIIHARKAWLDGLSPKENRTIPPLRYDYVYRLKREFPDLHISINGGIESLDSTLEHLQHVDGVMMGRAAYYSPALLAEADNCVFGSLADGFTHTANSDTLSDIARAYALYMQEWIKQGVRPSVMSRHLIALFQQVPGARLWRRHLSEQAGKTRDAVALVEGALAYLEREAQVSAARSA
ncbi:tRNA dihydrouridine(20/20a) synthase DusA [Granulosicoccus sp.]|nr:tRNA dihydrouridine(20/20a) synthase DusA [Granulosicoccus sp.]